MTIKTNKQYNFDKAENDTFSWTLWDDTNGESLTHNATGRKIYQMHWLDAEGKMSDKVEGALREQAVSFWREISIIRAEREAQLQNSTTETLLTAHEDLVRKMDDPNSDY